MDESKVMDSRKSNVHCSSMWMDSELMTPAYRDVWTDELKEILLIECLGRAGRKSP